ncbi:MAG: hypothetical protein ACR2F6_02430 [Mycobacteriales bacterium]
MPGDRASYARLLLLWVCLVVSVLAWRAGVYFSGGVDPVVAGKSLLVLVALVIAFRETTQSAAGAAIGARSFCLVTAYLVLTSLGAMAAGSIFASVVLAGRVLLLAITIMLTVRAWPLADVFRSLLTAMAAIGLVISVAGARSFLSGGRLTGGILPLNPNQIAFLLGPPILGLFWRLLHGAGCRGDLAAVSVLLGLTWLTGSRTGLLALLLGLVVVVLQVRRIPVPAFVGLVLTLPALLYFGFATNVADSFFSRGGTQSVTTLNSRTIAWHAAFSGGGGFWKEWFGGGLSVKTIPVTGTYWATQVVDSSWVSAFVQGGLIGLILLGVWSVVVLVSALRTPAPWRAFCSAVVVYVIARSVTATGLIDSEAMFLVMFAIAVSTESVTRRAMVDRRVPSGPAARDGLASPSNVSGTNQILAAGR